MRKIQVILSVCFLFLVNTERLSAQQDSLPGITDFVKEIQQSKDHHGQYCMVLWMPWQYWETALLQGTKGKPLGPELRDMVSTMKQYNIFGIIDVKISPLGMTYADQQIIRDSTVMIINDSLKLRPLAESEYPQTIRDLIRMLEPTMKQMLGQVGQNMTMVVFPNTDNHGNLYADAKMNSRFDLRWRYNFNFTWRLPLDVLTPPKYCPVDNEQLSGKFEYCPYHGKKLKSTK